jgi:hypothetical protein
VLLLGIMILAPYCYYIMGYVRNDIISTVLWWGTCNSLSIRLENAPLVFCFIVQLDIWCFDMNRSTTFWVVYWYFDIRYWMKLEVILWNIKSS